MSKKTPRYHCKDCGDPLYRGVGKDASSLRCRSCNMRYIGKHNRLTVQVPSQ